MTRPLSPAALQRLADRIADPMPTRREMAYAIIDEVAKAHGLMRIHITGPGRDARTCAARFEVYHRLRVDLRLSLPRIGQLVGGRHHASVLNGLQVWEHEHRADATKGVSGTEGDR